MGTDRHATLAGFEGCPRPPHWPLFPTGGQGAGGGRKLPALICSPRAPIEILKNTRYKIADEMRVVLAKTAYSPLLKSAGDYSCGVFDANGWMVAQGPDLPIHLGSMPDAVRAVVAAFAPDVHDGDVFIHNDPYFGGSHLPDVNVVRPAFNGSQLLGY